MNSPRPNLSSFIDDICAQMTAENLPGGSFYKKGKHVYIHVHLHVYSTVVALSILEIFKCEIHINVLNERKIHGR